MYANDTNSIQAEHYERAHSNILFGALVINIRIIGIITMKIISTNKKAYHDYEILEKLEAGIELKGSEIKAIRSGRVNLKGSHARIMQNSKSKNNLELFIINLHIATQDNTDNSRTRKLLVHKKEINRLIGKTQEKKLTLIPTKIYLKHGKAKVEIAVGRGKKLHDKREQIKKKDADRQMRRNLKSF